MTQPDDALTTSREARDRHAGRVEVLDKAKALATLPGDTYVTVEMAAAYFEVPVDAIEKQIRLNRDELEADGLVVLTGERLSAFKAESGYRSRAGSLTLLPRRAMLRLGMVLRDSRIARQVRDHLLDAEEQSRQIDYRALDINDPRFVMVLAQAAERSAAQAIEQRERADRAERELATIAPKAEAWDVLASAEGDFAVADAAKILSRDPAIKTGRDRLFAYMADIGWVHRQASDNRWRAYQRQVDLGRLNELPESHFHPRTGERVIDPPQVRVTVKGLFDLHKRMGGVRQLQIPMQIALSTDISPRS